MPYTFMRFQNYCLVALLLGGALPTVGEAQKQTATCPSEAPKMRFLATRFASTQTFQEVRSVHGVATTDSAQVRTLTNAAGDGTMCGKLLQLVQAADTVLSGSRYRLTFYKSGTHYLIVGVAANKVDPPAPNTIRLGTFSVLYIIAGGNKPYIKGRIAV